MKKLILACIAALFPLTVLAAFGGALTGTSTTATDIGEYLTPVNGKYPYIQVPFIYATSTNRTSIFAGGLTITGNNPSPNQTTIDNAIVVVGGGGGDVHAGSWLTDSGNMVFQFTNGYSIGFQATDDLISFLNNRSFFINLDNLTADGNVPYFHVPNFDGINQTSPAEFVVSTSTTQVSSINATSTTDTSTFAGSLTVDGYARVGPIANPYVGVLPNFIMDVNTYQNDFGAMVLANPYFGTAASSDFIWANDQTISDLGNYYVDCSYGSSIYNTNVNSLGRNVSFVNEKNGFSCINTDGPIALWVATTSANAKIQFLVGNNTNNQVVIQQSGLTVNGSLGNPVFFANGDTHSGSLGDCSGVAGLTCLYVNDSTNQISLSAVLGIAIPFMNANRITYLNGSNVLSDSANLTFDGSLLTGFLSRFASSTVGNLTAGTVTSTSTILAANGSVSRPSYSFSSTQDLGFYISSGKLEYASGGTNYWEFNTNILNGVQSSSIIRSGAGTALNPSIGFTSTTHTGLYSPSTGILGFAVDGIEVARITDQATGSNFGIGTTSPYAKLSVSGKGVFTSLVSTSTLSCSGSSALTTDATGLIVCGAITAGASYPFTPTTYFGASFQATTSPLLLYAGAAISTSSIGYLTVGALRSTSTATALIHGGFTIDGAFLSNGDNFVVKDSGGNSRFSVVSGNVTFNENGGQTFVAAVGDLGARFNIGSITTGARPLAVSGVGGQTGDLFAADTNGSGGNQFVIKADGKVGLASTTPWRTLGIHGTLAVDSLSAFTSGDSAVCQHAGGEITVDSGVSSCIVSTKTAKHDIQKENSQAAYDRIMKLQPVIFEYNGTNKPDIGLIAEDVAAVDPRYAQYDPKTLKPKAINWGAITADMITVLQSEHGVYNTISTTTTPSSEGFPPELGLLGLLGFFPLLKKNEKAK